MWQGQSVRARRENLIRLADDTGRPALIYVQEGSRGDAWTIPGYTAHRGSPALGPEHDSCVILVRNDGRILDKGAWKVPGGQWTWNSRRRAPRVWPWVVVDFDGLTIAAINVHQIPNGPTPWRDDNARAWNAGHRLLLDKVPDLARRFPDAVVVPGGDWNARLDAKPDHPASLLTLAEQLGALPRLRHIDGFLVVGGHAGPPERIESKYGSDAHRPVVVEVRA